MPPPEPPAAASISSSEDTRPAEPSGQAGAAPPAADAGAVPDPGQVGLAWQSARHAYWMGDHAEAEQAYLRLIELLPGNPNPHGELGNVYYAQGKWREAAQQFYAAGELLARMEQFAHARQMTRVLEGLAPEFAARLQEQISAAAGPPR